MYDTSMVRTPPSNRLVADVELSAGADSFHRPDSAALGSNWIGRFVNPPDLAIAGNRVQGTGVSGAAEWAAPLGLAPAALALNPLGRGVSMRFRGTASAFPNMRIYLLHIDDSDLALFSASAPAGPGSWQVQLNAQGPFPIPDLVDGDVLLVRQAGAIAKGYVNGVEVAADAGLDLPATVRVGFTLQQNDFADNFDFFSLQPVIL